jgi:hypothetical protein
MGGSFGERVEELLAATETDLTGSLTVDQVYAQYQETGLDFNHPRGGIALALASALLNKNPDILHKLSEAVLDGRDAMNNAMAEGMEGLNSEYYELAPREFHDLRASGSPEVMDGDNQVYHRAPNVHRLSEEELKAKQALKALGIFDADF